MLRFENPENLEDPTVVPSLESIWIGSLVLSPSDIMSSRGIDEKTEVELAATCEAIVPEEISKVVIEASPGGNFLRMGVFITVNDRREALSLITRFSMESMWAVGIDPKLLILKDGTLVNGEQFDVDVDKVDAAIQLDDPRYSMLPDDVIVFQNSRQEVVERLG